MRFISSRPTTGRTSSSPGTGQLFWYGLLVLLLVGAGAAAEYLLAQLTFILIYGIVGLGLMLLAGFTGLFSIGHAAFFGVGAYAQAVLTGMGWPFPLALAVGPRSRRGWASSWACRRCA